MHTNPKYFDWHETLTVSFEEACRGAYRNEFLAVTHRWEATHQPDPTGDQAVGLQAHLKAHPEIQYVFFDYSCLPQNLVSGSLDSRSAMEQQVATLTRNNIMSIYLGFSVLILMDDVTPTRFWCQLETWLALQKPTTAGLVPTPPGESRAHFMYYESTPEEQQTQFYRHWSACSAREAHARFSHANAKVSNPADKRALLPKVLRLDGMVAEEMRAAEQGDGTARGAASRGSRKARAAKLEQGRRPSKPDLELAAARAAARELEELKAAHAKLAAENALLSAQHAEFREASTAVEPEGGIPQLGSNFRKKKLPFKSARSPRRKGGLFGFGS